MMAAVAGVLLPSFSCLAEGVVAGLAASATFLRPASRALFAPSVFTVRLRASPMPKAAFPPAPKIPYPTLPYRRSYPRLMLPMRQHDHWPHGRRLCDPPKSSRRRQLPSTGYQKMLHPDTSHAAKALRTYAAKCPAGCKDLAKPLETSCEFPQAPRSGPWRSARTHLSTRDASSGCLRPWTTSSSCEWRLTSMFDIHSRHDCWWRKGSG